MELSNGRTLLALALGQFVSLLLTLGAFSSSELARQGVHNGDQLDRFLLPLQLHLTRALNYAAAKLRFAVILDISSVCQRI